MYADIYVKKHEEIPKGAHWAVFTFSSVESEAYGQRGTVPVVEYEAYLTHEKWVERITELATAKHHQPYYAAMITPAKVGVKVSVAVD